MEWRLEPDAVRYGVLAMRSTIYKFFLGQASKSECPRKNPLASEAINRAAPLTQLVS